MTTSRNELLSTRVKGNGVPGAGSNGYFYPGSCLSGSLLSLQLSSEPNCNDKDFR